MGGGVLISQAARSARDDTDSTDRLTNRLTTSYCIIHRASIAPTSTYRHDGRHDMLLLSILHQYLTVLVAR